MSAAESEQPDGVRASHAEREQYAQTVQQACTEGRLTIAAAEERLTRVYAAVYRHELRELVKDLPEEDRPQPFGGRREPMRRPTGQLAASVWNGALTTHAAVISVLAVLAIVAWVHSGVPFFWPAWPIGWLGISLLVHYRIRRRRQGGQDGPPSA